jgi:hypothetical protein
LRLNSPAVNINDIREPVKRKERNADGQSNVGLGQLIVERQKRISGSNKEIEILENYQQ